MGSGRESSAANSGTTSGSARPYAASVASRVRRSSPGCPPGASAAGGANGDHRLEQALLSIGSWAAPFADMRLGGEVLMEHLYQSGLANPRFAVEHHDLPQPVPCLGPARVQQRRFRLPPDQGRQPVRASTSRRPCAPLVPST